MTGISGDGLLGFGLGLIDTLFGAGQASKNNDLQQQTLDWNKQYGTDVLNWNKEQYSQTMAYNKWLNQTQMQREDTAIQRRMADLKAAGLSPLLAAGDAATSSAGSSLSAPELSAPQVNGYNRQPMQLGLRDAWNTAIQSMSEFNQMTKSDAEKKLINSQTEGQYLENKSTLDEMIFNSSDRILKLQQAQENINKTLQEIENMKKSGNLTDQQIKNMGLEEQFNNLKIQNQEIQNRINEEIEEQERLKTLVDKHDTNIYLASPMTSSITDQGMQTTVGKAAQDTALGVATGKSNEINEDLWNEYSNNNITPNNEIINTPIPNNLKKMDGYQDSGKWIGTKKGAYLEAGRNVAYGDDGSIYYGGYKIKATEDQPFEFIMNEIENTGRCPAKYLYVDN